MEFEHVDDLLAVFHEEICESACLEAVGDGFCDGGIIIIALSFVFLDAVNEIAVAVEWFAGLQDLVRFIIGDVDDVDAEFKVAARFFEGIGKQEFVSFLFLRSAIVEHIEFWRRNFDERFLIDCPLGFDELDDLSVNVVGI